MYRPHIEIGCLTVEVFPIETDVNVSCFLLDKELQVNTLQMVESVDVYCLPLKGITRPDVFPLEDQMEVSCFPICSINKDFYLRINPETIWLTYENGWSADVEINSNVQWIIN